MVVSTVCLHLLELLLLVPNHLQEAILRKTSVKALLRSGCHRSSWAGYTCALTMMRVPDQIIKGDHLQLELLVPVPTLGESLLD